MSGFDPRRALSIARKEVRHVLRDPFTLALALGLPVLLVTFFGFAIDFDVRDVRLLVHDADKSRRSRQFVDLFESSGYFRVARSAPAGGVLEELGAERASAVLVIEPAASRDMLAGRPVEGQLLLDGADNSRAGAILGYLAGLLQAAQERVADRPRRDGIELRSRFLYNHELNSRWFTIPGLTVVVSGLIAIMLTSLTVAREWENGSMELLLSTPVKPLEIILGKLAPYLGLGAVGIAFVYLVARLGFGVPFRGSHALFAASSLLFLVAGLSQGLLISVLARQQQLAMQFSMMVGLLPSLLLSGFVFPVESMPAFFQYATSILPQKWFMMAARGIFLKGSGAAELAGPLLALALLDIVLIAAAGRRFKRDLEP